MIAVHMVDGEGATADERRRLEVSSYECCVVCECYVSCVWDPPQLLAWKVEEFEREMAELERQEEEKKRKEACACVLL